MSTRLGTLKLDSGLYDDLQVFVSSARLPASNAPSWATYDFGIGSGVAFNVLGFGVDEYIDFYVQTPHSMQLNTVLDNHIHFTLPTLVAGDENDKFKFQLDVIAAGVDGTWAVPTGSPFTAEHTIALTDDTTHRLLDLADIPAVNTTVSTIYICRLKRIAASPEFDKDVYILYNDSHFLRDSLGSRSEYTK